MILVTEDKGTKPNLAMEINLLGHCLLCLDKTRSSNYSIQNGLITRKTLVEKVLPQLILDKSGQNGNNVKELFNHLRFCSAAQKEKVEKRHQEDEMPSLCSSCLEQMSVIFQLFEQLELKTETLRMRIYGGYKNNRHAFTNKLRTSDEVDKDSKVSTLELLECLLEECCETSMPEELVCDLNNGKNGSSAEEEDSEIVLEPHLNGNDELMGTSLQSGKYVSVTDVSKPMVDMYDLINDNEQDVASIMKLPHALMTNDNCPGNFVEHKTDVNLCKMSVEKSSTSKPGTQSTANFHCPKPDCNKWFSQSSYLLRHMRTTHRFPHKPFICEYCGKGYNYNYNLKYHVESRHLRTNYICQICGKGFAGTSPLKKHQRLHQK